jgi:hypothetical protein
MRTVNLIVDYRGWREAQLATIESIVSTYQTSNFGPLIIEAGEIRRVVEAVILSFYVLDLAYYYYINNFVDTRGSVCRGTRY